MTIRVFIGSAANGEDAESCAVLEYSLRQHSSQPLDLVWMRQSRDPASPFHGWATAPWATPFSGFRWAVPALCGYEGRALYCDSDVIFMADVADLWNQPFQPGRIVMGKGSGAGRDAWRLCVSLWDCAAAKSLLPSLGALKAEPFAHQRLIQLARNASWVQAFAGDWNCLDGAGHASLDDPELKAIHYTAIIHQLHLKHALPRLAASGRSHWFDGKFRAHPRADLQALFDQLLAEAESAGFPVARYEPEKCFGAYVPRVRA